MKKYIRIITLLLALVFIAALLPSCVNRGNGDETTPDDNAATTLGKYNIGNNIPASVRYDEQTIKVVSRNADYVRDEIYVDGTNGMTVNDAIFKRNDNIKKKLGITIDNTQLVDDSSSGQYAVSEAIRKLGKVYTYDVISNSCYSTIMYANEGIFHNLTDLEYLDLSRPYWSQGFNEVASIGTSQYMCTGASALTFCRYMFVTMFNKKLAQEYDIENLYEVVNNKKWTLDYQAKLIENTYANLDDNAEASSGDRFGFVSCQSLYVDPYWSSCDMQILAKDVDNYYFYNLNLERISAVSEKILKLFYDSNSYIYKSSGDDKTNHEALTNHFASDRSLTTTLRLAAVEDSTLRDMTSLYGILPMPKYDELQEEYKTYLHDQFTALAISSSVPADRVPMVGAFLEYFASESYAEVLPKYYDLALKNRYLSDPESAQMLDLIYNSVYIDAGVLYTKVLNSVHQSLRSVISSKTNTVGSKFSSTTNNTIKLNLRSLNEDFKLLESK